MENDQHHPDEPTQDPLAEKDNLAESIHSEAPLMSQPKQWSGIKQSHFTGEHPAIHATSGDKEALSPIRGGLERISSPQHNQEPEDNLPDLLDKNK